MPLFRLLKRVADSRPPDFVIGDPEQPYLRRWWIVPRNRFFNIYLHNMLRNDEDRALHDHMYVNCSILLSGGYIEVTKHGRFIREPGAIVFRRPTTAHRLELPAMSYSDFLYGDGAWSLFITGPRVREWGFHCPQGWVHWKKFVAPGADGQIGKGCEQ